MALTLEIVETAIEGLLSSGQSFTVAGIKYEQASLTPLMELRKQLRSEGGTSVFNPFGYHVRPLKPPVH